MNDRYIALPELCVQKDSILNFALGKSTTDWLLLPWGQYSFFKWHGCNEIKMLSSVFTDKVKISVIECMRFDAGTGLPVHKDNKRQAVIQIPLSANCSQTPTLFYNEDKVLLDSIKWAGDVAYLFDTHTWHSVFNDSTEPRFMLCVSFYKHTYAELKELYLANSLFVED